MVEKVKKKKTIVIMAHPDRDSFCADLANAYCQGLEQIGSDYGLIKLVDLDFDLVPQKNGKDPNELEPSLKVAQAKISWAEHIVIVFPIWWGTPALLKAFVERVFLPGYAYQYRPDSPVWERLLSGKTGRIIVTSDTPILWNTWRSGNVAIKGVKKNILGFCGVRPVKVTKIGSVMKLCPDKKEKYRYQVKSLGEKNI